MDQPFEIHQKVDKIVSYTISEDETDIQFTWSNSTPN